MFRGVATFNLDAKGRMAVPAKFRKLLDACCEGNIVITIDYSAKCLQLYPIAEWIEVEKKLANLPTFNAQLSKLKRKIAHYVTEFTMDSNGRVVLPAKLREFANLDKASVMVGQGNKLEIWSESAWNALMDECLEEDIHGELPPELQGLVI